MSLKTQAMGIVVVEYHGGLLEHFASPKPILPGTVIMVPDETRCVLVAGDEPCKMFGEGPHELDLMMFNRQPSGQLYVVDKKPKSRSGTTVRGDMERHIEVQITNPIAFVRRFVIEQSVEEDYEIWKSLFQLVDGALSITEKPHIRETVDEILGEKLLQMGLAITDFFETTPGEGSPEKKTLRIRKTPFSPAGKTGPSHKLKINSVWATSTMDLFSKGELTLVVRVTAAPEMQSLDGGNPVYDETLRWESPDGWLDARKWQDLPEDALEFKGLDPAWAIRVHVSAEERDKNSVDELGETTCEIPHAEENFQLGPTEGGKRNNHITLKASLCA